MIRQSRKIQFIILLTLVCLVGTMTIAYAVLSTTLNINGTAQVMDASWDIHFGNIKVDSGSVTSAIPVVDKTSVSFVADLNNPGDYYMFTVDMINSGSIDAMINEVIKTPDLTAEQKKYLNYEIEYQSGDDVSVKQRLDAGSYLRLKVKIAYRNDIDPSLLPSSTETLNLLFTVNYVQADDNENLYVENNGNILRIVSGNLNTVGSEVCIDKECFYVISSDNDNIKMLSKYNLYVGGTIYENNNWVEYGDEATGLQEPTMLGWVSTGVPFLGSPNFSSINFWYDNGIKEEYGSSYPVYVYGENSDLTIYVESYKKYLSSFGIEIIDSYLISYDELEKLGCDYSANSCLDAPEWVWSTSYFTGEARDEVRLAAVYIDGELGGISYNVHGAGVRPVIVIPRSEF